MVILTRQSFGLVALLSMLSLGVFAYSGSGTRGSEPSLLSSVVMIDHVGHRRVIRAFLADMTVPRGLTSPESLPPGLVSELRAQGRLPPGLREHLTPIPPDLGISLPPVPAFFSRYFAGRDLIIIDTRSNRILSVLRDVLP